MNEVNANVEQLLKQRAARLAEQTSNDQERVVAYEVAVVSVGEEKIGLPAVGLREIVNSPAISNLPGLPPFLRGFAQIRGDLLSVMDLGTFLDLRGQQEGEYLAVIEGQQGPFGILADEVHGFRAVYEDELATSFSSIEGRPVAAMTTDLVSILDLDRLLSDDQLIVEHS